MLTLLQSNLWATKCSCGIGWHMHLKKGHCDKMLWRKHAIHTCNMQYRELSEKACIRKQRDYWIISVTCFRHSKQACLSCACEWVKCWMVKIALNLHRDEVEEVETSISSFPLQSGKWVTHFCLILFHGIKQINQRCPLFKDTLH